MSIQEDVHEIVGLDLVICSDYLTNVSLGRALFLCKEASEFSNKKDLILSYRNCQVSNENMTLESYFYELFTGKDFYIYSTT